MLTCWRAISDAQWQSAVLTDGDMSEHSGQWQYLNLPVLTLDWSVPLRYWLICCTVSLLLQAYTVGRSCCTIAGQGPLPIIHEANCGYAVLQMRTHGQQTYVQPTPFEAPHQPSFYEEEDNECVVCMDSEANQFFNPCGHVLCCHTCAEKIMHNSKLCPVCNTAIAEFGFCSWAQVQ